jgi:hypothetical protein
LDTFAAPLDDELVWVHSIGLVHSKLELLGMFGHALGVRDVQRKVRQVIVIGDVALVTMAQRMRFPLAGSPEQELDPKTVASVMWRRRGQPWQLVQFQATVLEAASGLEVSIVLPRAPRHGRRLRAGAGAELSLALCGGAAGSPVRAHGACAVVDSGLACSRWEIISR